MSTARMPDVESPRGPVRFLREIISVPSLVVAALAVLLGLPATILLTPDPHTTVAGQELAGGARIPSLSWTGPAQLVQIGNTELDVPPLKIAGPLRPRITLGPVQRNADAAAALDSANGDARSTAQSQIQDAFMRWYLWAAVILLAITIGLVALAACLRMLVAMRREGHALEREDGEHPPLTVYQLWQRSRTQVRAMATLAIITALAAWAGSGALAVTGVQGGLSHVRSLADLVGSRYVPPLPFGPPIPGYVGAVIGDSRAARVGGTIAAEASDEDRACGRSTDSLATEIAALASVPVANLACSGATTLAGLRGPQHAAGIELPPQVARLNQLTGLRFVVVVIGPNDLGWGDQLRYCYGVEDCRDRLTDGEFTYRLAAFDSAYGDLLHDLNDLPGAPQVIIMTSYDVFTADPACPDAQGPPGAVGISDEDADLLAERNQALNDVLVAGAEKYGFDVARPRLTPLCVKPSDSLGPDIQGLADPAPFHPTGVGVLRLASSVVRVMDPVR